MSLPAYTRAEARRIEAFWCKNMPGAGKRSKRVVGPPAKQDQDTQEAKEGRAVVLEWVREHGPITTSGLAKKMGTTSRCKLDTQIAGLMRRGEIKRVGGGHFQKWVVT